MTNYINIGGQDRPYSFSYQMVMSYEYESQTARGYLRDVHEFARELIAAGAAANTDDTSAAAMHVSVVKCVDLFYAAFRAGHIMAKVPIQFTKYDLAEWLGADPSIVAKLSTELIEANFDLKNQNGETANDEPGAAKKKTRTTASTGTNS